MYGYIHDYQTGAQLREATLLDLIESLTSGPEGTFLDRDKRTVYVEGETSQGRNAACNAISTSGT